MAMRISTKPVPVSIKAIRAGLPPDALEFFRQCGRKGGRKGSREAKVKAGRISALKRWANVPRCPLCNRILPKGYQVEGTTLRPINKNAKH